MSSLSIVILTFNSEKRIREVLESAKFADEIIVVDSQSTDQTIEIAAEFTDKIFTRVWPGYSAQWNFAIDQAKGDWVFPLASDEIITEQLQKEIQEIIAKDNQQFNGYYVRRLAFFLDKPIYHCGWYPGYELRLFRNGKGRFNSKEVHEYLEVEGELKHIESDLLHYTYDSLFQYLERLNRYTDLEVKELLKTKEPQAIKFSKWGLVRRSLKVFKKMYFKQKGYKDRMPGFILCLLSSIYRLIGDIKLWEKLEGSK